MERISTKDPVAIVEVERETRPLGGGSNVVHNLVGLGAQGEVLGLVGEDNPGLTEARDAPAGGAGGWPVHETEPQPRRPSPRQHENFCGPACPSPRAGAI